MKILFFGDLVGKLARNALKKILPKYKAKYNIDLVLANSDNLAHGRGITEKTIKEVFGYGIDILTCGDHVWDTSEAVKLLKNNKYNLLCPANYPIMTIEKGYRIFDVKNKKILVVNIAGRVFFQRFSDCPFDTAEKIIDENRNKADVILVDIHAEATSEKKAFGFFLDSKVSAILGTHTHVQTADEEVLKGGTAYITDVGMVGPFDSIIGCKKEVVINQMRTQIPFKYEISAGNEVIVNAVIVDVDENSGKAFSISRVSEIMKRDL